MTTAPSGSVPVRNAVLFWILALGGAAFDLVTKSVIFRWVGPPGRPPISVLSPVLELRTSHNAGALWGIGSGFPHSSLLFALLSIGAGIFIYHWLFRLGNARDLRQTVALGLIMAGALGNCHDRIRFGYVRDFVYFHVDSIGFDFPIFNFADNMLVAGAAILLFLALRPEQDPGEAIGSAAQDAEERLSAHQ
jgi:signal peptidase II